MPMSEATRAAILTGRMWPTELQITFKDSTESVFVNDTEIERALRVLALLDGLSEEQMDCLTYHAEKEVERGQSHGDRWASYVEGYATLLSALKEVGGAE